MGNSSPKVSKRESVPVHRTPYNSGQTSSYTIYNSGQVSGYSSGQAYAYSQRLEQRQQQQRLERQKQEELTRQARLQQERLERQKQEEQIRQARLQQERLERQKQEEQIRQARLKQDKLFRQKEQEWKNNQNLHEEIQIPNNGIGYDYERLCKRLLGPDVFSVTIEDPYIQSIHQIYNFLRFCELLVKHCPELSEIYLLTTSINGKTDKEKDQQKTRLETIKNNLEDHGIILTISYSSTLHDRAIRFSSGWIMKIGRGLDIYKAPKNNLIIGYCDYSLRACHRTTVNIFHSKHTSLS